MPGESLPEVQYFPPETMIVPPPRSVAMVAPLLPVVLAVTLVAVIVPPPLAITACAYLPLEEILVPSRVIAVPLPQAKTPLAPSPVVVTMSLFTVIEPALARTPASRP